MNAQFITLVVTALFLSVIAHLWIASDSYTAMVMGLAENRMYLGIALAMVAVVVLSVLKLMMMWVGEDFSNVKSLFVEHTQDLLSEFMYYSTNSNLKVQGEYLREMALHIALRVCAKCDFLLVERLLVSGWGQRSGRNIRFVTINILWFVAIANSACSWMGRYLKSRGDSELLLTVISMATALEILHAIMIQTIFVVDVGRDSNRAFQVRQGLELFIRVCMLLILFWQVGTVSGTFDVTMISLFTQGYFVFKSFMTFVKAIKMTKSVTTLRVPTEQEACDLCILCRSENNTYDSRVLPCGHVMHAECLARWLTNDGTCPICHEDVLSALKTQGGESVIDTFAHVIVPENNGEAEAGQEDEHLHVAYTEFEFSNSDLSEVDEEIGHAAEELPTMVPPTTAFVVSEHNNDQEPQITVAPESDGASDQPVEQGSDPELQEILESISRCESELARLKRLVHAKLCKQRD